MEPDTLVKRRQSRRDKYQTKYKTAKYKESLEKKLSGWLQGQRDIEWENRREMRENQRWYNGELTNSDELARRNPALRDLKLNTIRQSVDYVSGMAKGRATNGSVVLQGHGMYAPAEATATIQEFNRRMSMVQSMTDFSYFRDLAIDSACQCGVGYLHTGVRANHENGKFRFFCSSPHWENVYTDTSSISMENAQFCIIVNPVDAEYLARHYPNYATEINDRSSEYLQSAVADDNYREQYSTSAGNPIYEREEFSGSDFRKQLIYGTAYYQDTIDEDGFKKDIYLSCKICCDRDYSKVMILQDPVYLGHSRPPVARLYKAVHSSRNLPYTDLISDKRGLGRTINALLRNTIPLLSGRGIVANIEGMDMPEADTYLKSLAKRVAQSVFVIPEYGEKGSVQVHQFGDQANQLMGTLSGLNEISRSLTSIHPALLGEATNVDAAQTMQSLKHDAGVAVSTFFRNCDQQLVKVISEEHLSAIERYNGMIDFGLHNQNNKLIEAGSDGDSTIEGNRAYFAVVPTHRDDLVSKQHTDMVQALISRADPAMAFAIYMLELKSMNNPDANAMIEDLKTYAIENGIPVFSSLLTEEEKQQKAQQAEQQSQLSQQEIMLQLGKLQADIDHINARAHKTMVDANEPMQSKKELQMEQTIEKLSNLLMKFMETQG